MTTKYIPPALERAQFHCPHCQVFAKQHWSEALSPHRPGYAPLGTGALTAICEHCDARSYWIRDRMFYPASTNVAPAHPNMPDGVQELYDEAASIESVSPRAAAGLLRVAVEVLVRGLTPGAKGDLNDRIAALVAGGLPIEVQQALDSCRVVGNNALHPGQIDLNQDPDLARLMFEMVNLIVESRIAQPLRVAALYARLPEGVKQAIAKRDGGAEAAG